MLTVAFATQDRPPASTRGREVNVWRDDAGQVFARGFSGPGVHHIEWPGLATFQFQPGSRQVTVWLEDPARRADAADVVTRVLQPVILQAIGWQALHGSASLLPEGVVAFCGRSGNGKSTLAYTLAARGFPQFADDALLIDVAEDAIRAIPLPFVPRLRESARRELRGTGAVQAPDARALLRHVVILEQDARLDAPVIDRIPHVQAFSALLAHAHCFDPSPGAHARRLVGDLLSVAQRVPVARLRYAPDLARLDEVIDVVLATVEASGAVRPAVRSPR